MTLEITCREEAWGRAIWSVASSGLVFLAVLLTTTIPAATQTYSVVYAFPGGTLGAFPFGAITRSHTGYVYGTTYKTDGASGGTGFGVVYTISATGQETVLHTFQGSPNDGADSKAGTIHYDGLYTATTSGGSSTNCTSGCGVVATHPINQQPPYSEKVLHDFAGGSEDGASPTGDMARDSSSNLYGLTTYGGDTHCSAHGCGVVYEVTPAGVETIMHKFSGTDGQFPRAGLFLSGTTLYGTTSAGGASNAGTLFKIDLSGNFTTLYEFQGGADGSAPEGSVMLDSAGNILGTTFSGGGSTNCSGGCGTVFKVDPTGHETVLHSFTGGVDGANPRGVIAMDDRGYVVFGVASIGGQGHPGFGVIYEVSTSSGNQTVIHAFAGGADGQSPFGGVVKDAFGNLYGTTVYGGDMSCGTRGCGVLFKAHP
jgi:uncharacterized repeat protein (TIGR03803 family)